MVGVLYLNVRLAKVTGAAEARNLAAADDRIGMLTQMVEAIKAVKFFSWERPYEQGMEELRVEECKHIQYFRVVSVTSIALGRASPTIGSCIVHLDPIPAAPVWSHLCST